MHKIVVQYWHLLFLVCIVFIGVALRCKGLARESLWYDEIGSIDHATRSFPSFFWSLQQEPPLYPLLLRYWLYCWGVSEAALRSLSVIFGVGTLLLSYYIGKRLFNRRIAYSAVFLLTLSPFHIFYSQEVRYYMMSLFLFLLSVHVFLRLLTYQTKRLYGYLCLIHILLLFTNPLGMLLIVVENIYFFSMKTLRRHWWIIVQVIPLACFLVWLIPVICTIHAHYDYYDQRFGVWAPHVCAQMVIDTLETFHYGGIRYGGAEQVVAYADSYTPVRWLLNILFIELFIYGCYVLFRKGQYRKTAYFVVLWLLVPYVLWCCCAPGYLSRYFLISLPAYYMIVAAGIAGLPTRLIRICAVGMVSLLLMVPVYTYYTNQLKIPWREIVSFVDRHTQSHDIIIVVPSKILQIFGYYGKYGITSFCDDIPRYHHQLRQTYHMIEGPCIIQYGNTRLLGVSTLNQLYELRDSNIMKGYNVMVLVSSWCGYPAAVRRFFDAYYTKDREYHYSRVSMYRYLCARSLQ